MEVKFNHARYSTASYQLPHPPEIPAQATLFVCASGKIRLQPRLVIRFLQSAGRRAGRLACWVRPALGLSFHSTLYAVGMGITQTHYLKITYPNNSHNSY